MPFTFSHPAVVMPLLLLPQRWRSATGLIIGSLTPDFEKFLRMSAEDPYSHTWRSIFYFNLPLGLVLIFVFHLLVRDALITHLPVFLRLRFNRYVGQPWATRFKKSYGVVLLSLLLGTVSHIVWDSFTHKDGRGIQLFPVLGTIIKEGKDNVYLFEVGQTVSTLLGLGLMVYFILRLNRDPLRLQPTASEMLRYWGSMIVLTALVFGLKKLLSPSSAIDSMNEVVIVLISAGLLSLVLVSSYFRKKLHSN